MCATHPDALSPPHKSLQRHGLVQGTMGSSGKMPGMTQSCCGSWASQGSPKQLRRHLQACTTARLAALCMQVRACADVIAEFWGRCACNAVECLCCAGFLRYMYSL
jgi:hypothetical protein